MTVGALVCMLVKSAAVEGVDEETRLGFVWYHIHHMIYIGPWCHTSLAAGEIFCGEPTSLFNKKKT